MAPTGKLASVTNANKLNTMEKTDKTEIRIIKNGPLKVTGNFVLKGPEGVPVEIKDPTFLCRCGASANKPFCDGAHRKAGIPGVS